MIIDLGNETIEEIKQNRLANESDVKRRIRERAIKGREVRLLTEEKRKTSNLERKKNRVNNNRLKSRFKKYGMTEGDYKKMLDSQSGKCALCGNKLIKTTIDHDHITGKVRGVLCPTCNTLLGMGHDNPARFFAAATYLIENKAQGIDWIKTLSISEAND